MCIIELISATHLTLLINHF